ncbi:MAG: class I mannose-6-phosphate isomerase [Marinilabiliaceae bacterium]|nr:class I mannose-6-phosphate isomerase [Marinilabiliaceae bacterium]
MRIKLYPLKLKPILKESIWGGTKLHEMFAKPIENLSNIAESWEVSGVKDNVSIVANGLLRGKNLLEILECYQNELVGNHVYEKYGNAFPILLKFIDAKEPLSIQVHPNDEIAALKHNSIGKSELWYIIEAEKDAHIINGLNSQLKKEDFANAIEKNCLEQYLVKHNIAAGDVFYIPAGRVHAIGAGVLLAEIQQTSDITYRIYDFNRTDSKGKKRELHTKKAKRAIDTKLPQSYKTEYKMLKNKGIELINSQHFVTNIIEIDKPVERTYTGLDSFIILTCFEGNTSVEFRDGKNENLRTGDTLLIPAIIQQVMIVPKEKSAKLLEIYCP